ncbi:MAG: C39 family peptidase [Candidatus Bathyarchaeota archaeon]|nr:C39 family peptidase [Candidatus Bathyarchaeota archaeon]
MSRKLVFFILVSSIMVMLPISATFSQFVACGKRLDESNIEVSNSAAYLPVPFHYQNKSYYCGPAALEMVFDYYGEDVPQAEIADVARTYPYVTFTDELLRAAHFSNMSISQGDEIPDSNITGYSARKVGYSAFEQWPLTIEDLETLIDKGEPTIVLMWWSSAKLYGHYRVVIGYNTTHVITHDPWNKDWGGEYGGANTSMTNETFLDLWEYSNYWGLWVKPWDIELQIPSIVSKGDDFEVIANITYLCSTPFSTTDYPASFCNATIELQEGLELGSGETKQHALGNIFAGNSVQTSWSIQASETGSYNLLVTAMGIIEGSVWEHETYPSYNYQDAIGGLCVNSLSVADQICRVHNVDTKLNFTTIQEAINDLETADGHTILVDSGIFYEHVVINKSVILIGEDPVSTIIDGSKTGNVTTVISDNVNITGFTIQNGGDFSEWPNAYGVLVESNNNYLARNIITNNSQGILLKTSNNNTLRENNMTNNVLNFGVGWNPTLGIFHFLHDIDESNKVDGFPIYYWISQHNKQIPRDAGSVYAINSNNILVKDITVTNDIVCFAGTNNSKIENVSSDSGAICLTSSHNNQLLNNVMKKSQISLIYSNNNIVVGNTVSDAEHGIYLFGPSHDNTIYHNNLVNNTKNVYIHTCNNNSQKNFWDNGFEGNYWSNYTGVDPDHDGIGNSWHVIDQNNTDYNPLMGMFSDFSATSEHQVQTICNSTISNFHFNGTAIIFNVSGENGTNGFCRICIPTALMNETYRVFVNGTEVSHTPLTSISNNTHSYLYFTYNHSTQETIIIPEFPSFLILPLFMIATLLAAIVYRRKHST